MNLNASRLRLLPVSELGWLAKALSESDFVGLPKHLDSVGNAEMRAFAVHDPKGLRVGWALYHQFDWKNRNVSIAWEVPEAFASELVGALLGFAFAELNLERVETRVLEHSATAAVLTRNGFVLEGIERRAALRHNAWLDVAVYGLLRNV